MMRNKGTILVLVLLLVVVGYVLMQQKAQAPAPEREMTVSTDETTAAPSFSWRFETKDSEGGLPPRTQVALFAGGNAYDAGIYAGSCAEIEDENLLENEISGVLCWYAGGGDELGVFKEGDGYVLKHGTQEEGTVESNGFRGDFTQIAKIK